MGTASPAPETRSTQSVSTGLGSDESNLLRLLGLEGITTHVTPKAAMGIPTFYGCVRLIAELIASQPFAPYRKLKGGGSEVSKDHPLWMLWHLRPNAQMSSYEMRRMMIVNLKVHGFAVARIVRDEKNRPASIVPYPSPQIDIYFDTVTESYFFKHEGKKLAFSEDDAIFLKDLNLGGDKPGSIVDWQSRTIKTHLLANKFTERYYEKGAFVSGLLSSPLIKSKESAETYKEAFLNALSTGEHGGSGLAAVGPETTYTPITRSNTESQLIEFLEKSDNDIYKFCGVSPNLIGDTNKASSWGASVENAFIMLVQTVLLPLGKQFEEEVDYKCFRADEIKADNYHKFNFRALLRGDAKTYAEYVRTMLTNGVISQDEVRAWDEMAPIPEGHGANYWIQGAMMRLDNPNPASPAPNAAPQPAIKNGFPINGHTLSEQ